jgi:hypothetical protein
MTKSFLVTLMVLAGLALPSAAEIKILNYTGEELKVDVLHADGQARDVPIGKAVGISKEIGPVHPRRTSEMLVVKDAAGKEIFRTEVYAQSLNVINKDNTSVGMSSYNAGYFKGPAEHGMIKLLNGTGQTVNYSYETPDFRLVTGTVETSRPGLEYREIVADGPFRMGQNIQLKLGINEPASGGGQPVVAGSVYFASYEGGQLKLTKVSSD